MTIYELKEILNKYPDDMCVTFDDSEYGPCEVDDVTTGKIGDMYTKPEIILVLRSS